MMQFPRNGLKLDTSRGNTAVSSTSTSSAVTEHSVKSSPASSVFRRSRGKDSARSYPMNHSAPSSPELTSLPPYPSSPEEDGSKKGFFPSLRYRKSSSNVRSDDHPTIRTVPYHRHRDSDEPESPIEGVPATEPFDFHALNAARRATQPTAGSEGTGLSAGFATKTVKPAALAQPALHNPRRIDKEQPPLPVLNRSESSLGSYPQARPTTTIPFSASTRTLTSPKGGERPSLFGRFKATSLKASDGFRKAAGMFQGKKAGRSGSHSGSGSAPGGRPLYEDNFVPRLLVLTLAEQVKLTRPRKLAHELQDQTVFWLPALPHRCLEFLKSRGYQEEGLYRVNGAVPDVKHWYQRFDREGDIDLMAHNIADINSIGSLLKQWLRELPSEIFPKDAQARVKAAHPAATEVPQLMKEELSLLPPENYHLLRAITGHLADLIKAERRTRMNFEAVRTCMPSLKIETHCLRFLLTQWDSCWVGCQGQQAAYQREVAEMRELGLLTAGQVVAARPPPELERVQPLSPIRADFA